MSEARGGLRPACVLPACVLQPTDFGRRHSLATPAIAITLDEVAL